MRYDETSLLALPRPGDHGLLVLSPAVLELTLITTKPPDPACPTEWDFVSAKGEPRVPKPAEFEILVDGKPVPESAVGFKRRVLYAPLRKRGLRIAKEIHLQLVQPIGENQTVEVRCPTAHLRTNRANVALRAGQCAPARREFGFPLAGGWECGQFPVVNHFALPLALLVLTGVPVAQSSPAQEMNAPVLDLVQGRRPLIIGHRGYPTMAPENTLPSFKLALLAGADFVELDYHLTKDGVPLVIHDDTLDRTTDGTNRWGGVKLPVAARTTAELQTLDAGKWFDAKFAGTKLPLLSEALDTIQGGGGMTLIERKEGDAVGMAKLLRERKLTNRLVVQSFDWQYLRELHALVPEQLLGALGPPKCFADGSKPPKADKNLNAAWLDELAKTGAKIAVWSKDVTKEGVALAHQQGLKVWVYTIDDPKLANALLDLGVDGIITNNTSQLWRMLALRGWR